MPKVNTACGITIAYEVYEKFKIMAALIVYVNVL